MPDPELNLQAKYQAQMQQREIQQAQHEAASYRQQACPQP